MMCIFEIHCAFGVLKLDLHSKKSHIYRFTMSVHLHDISVEYGDFSYESTRFYRIHAISYGFLKLSFSIAFYYQSLRLGAETSCPLSNTALYSKILTLPQMNINNSALLWDI